MSKIVWKSAGVKVIKQKHTGSIYKYIIWDDNTNEEIILYENGMLAMCYAVIKDAKESEE